MTNQAAVRQCNTVCIPVVPLQTDQTHVIGTSPEPIVLVTKQRAVHQCNTVRIPVVPLQTGQTHVRGTTLEPSASDKQGYVRQCNTVHVPVVPPQTDQAHVIGTTLEPSIVLVTKQRAVRQCNTVRIPVVPLHTGFHYILVSTTYWPNARDWYHASASDKTRGCSSVQHRAYSCGSTTYWPNARDWYQARAQCLVTKLGAVRQCNTVRIPVVPLQTGQTNAIGTTLVLVTKQGAVLCRQCNTVFRWFPRK